MTTYHQIFYDNDEHVLVDLAKKAQRIENARSINVADAAGTHTGTQASFDGTGDVTIRLPAVIGADITGSAQTATNADHATTADTATTAATATRATNADHATSADSATTADTQTSATTAEHALTADNASYADNADHATSADNATTASTAQEATHATSADSATTAASATTASSAAKLTTARTFRTNLASTSAPSFDGTADCTPGVSGVLPIANGGTGSSSKSWVDLSNSQEVGGTKTFTSDTINVAKSTVAREYHDTDLTDTKIVVKDVNGADLLSLSTSCQRNPVEWYARLERFRGSNSSFALALRQTVTNGMLYLVLIKNAGGTVTSVVVASL